MESFRVSADLSTFTTVKVFTGPNGADLQDVLIQGADGMLYGTTNQGGNGNNGTVFRMNFTGSVFQTIYRFQGQPDGAASGGGVIQGTDGNLYGPTFSGGPANRGTIYQLDPVSQTLTTIHAFTGHNEDGSTPEGALIQSADGFFYGTTQNGGGDVNNSGTVFKMDADGNVTVMHVFGGAMDGRRPTSELIQGTD